MDSATITHGLKKAIGGRRVVHAVFSTYTFEADFFELEILPALFSSDYAYSPSGIYRRAQLEQQLLETGLAIDIYYDATIFNCEASPLLEYRCFGVDVSPYAFHAKLIVLLIRDEESGAESIILGAGSNNLSEAAWLSNLECCHFTEMGTRRAPAGTVAAVRNAFDFLSALRAGIASTATDAISAYLNDLHTTKDEPGEKFYFQTGQAGAGNFISFIRDNVGACRDIEIISPFFPDSAQSNLHLTLKAELQARSCRILLPRDPQLNGSPAMTTREFNDHVKAQGEQGVSWSDWRDDLEKVLGGNQPRRLHAKLFLMLTAKASFVFAGSVNFSWRAFYNNVEAGFLVREPSRTSLLKDLVHEPVQFLQNPEPAPGEHPGSPRKKMHLYCSYDWYQKESVFSASIDCGIEFLDEACRPFLGPIDLAATQGSSITVSGRQLSILERLLGNTSLIRARMSFPAEEEQETRWVVVQQIGTIYRPSRLPCYSIMEILSLYSSPTVERRMGKIEEAAVRGGFDLWQDGDENSTMAPELPATSDMFSEFSQIHTAFRQMRKRIDRARQQAMWAQVDYFLTGERPDSIQGVLGALEQSKQISAVAEYLILLSCLEVLDGNPDRPAVPCVRAAVQKRLALQKVSGKIVINGLDKDKFFEWYEEEFSGSLRSTVKEIDPLLEVENA